MRSALWCALSAMLMTQSGRAAAAQILSLGAWRLSEASFDGAHLAGRPELRYSSSRGSRVDRVF